MVFPWLCLGKAELTVWQQAPGWKASNSKGSLETLNVSNLVFLDQKNNCEVEVLLSLVRILS